MNKSEIQSEKKTILIVDDLEINREILIGILQPDYTLLEAGSAAEAIKVLTENLYTVDLLLLDIVMPGKNGFEVLRIMKENGWLKWIPVIMISAENTLESVERAYEDGATDYIGRPFDAAVVRQRVKNTLMLYSKQKKLIQTIVNQVCEREKHDNMMVNILSNIVEFRNGESGLHVIHIRSITEEMCNYLVDEGTPPYRLKPEDVPLIVTASALHDVGKIAIPEKILNKPGKLTEKEFEQIKTHTVIGASMMEKLIQYQNEPLIRVVHDICRWHHERWDGRGYPDGLKGNEIPVSAQIVALADVFDALTSKRVYKDAIPPEEAVRMILDGECGAFNPILLEGLKKKWRDLENSAEDGSSLEQERINHAVAQALSSAGFENYGANEDGNY